MAISLPQDVLSTSDRRLIDLENQVQRLMEAHLAPKPLFQVNKITSSCEICSGPHDTYYCMENPEQAFVDYASSRTDEARGKWYTFKPEQNNLGDTYNPSWKTHPNLRLSKFEANFKQQQGEMTNKIDTVLKSINDRITGGPPSDTVKKTKLNSTSLIFSARSYSTPILVLYLIIVEGCPLNLKIPCNIGHVHVEKAYIDLNSPLNVMTRMQYNWIIRKQLKHREDPEGIRGIKKITKRIKGMYIFVENFTYVSDFMIVEDISLIINPRLSQIVLGRPFVEVSNMTNDLSLGVVKFTDRTNEVAYKMPHKREQYNSLSDMEKEHTKLVSFRNEEDKRKGVEYVMDKILGFYKEYLELEPEYLSGLKDKRGVT
nr:retrotransposon Orf1 [Tanacetum cinerariifolium]